MNAAYYNEHDPYAAQWLRNLIAAGHIAPGDVDERSIEDVAPSELAGYTQCHFFAGIGVWSYALRRAGWPDDRPVWTGSCPCQPFSAAGKGAGFADERHLWPAWFHLIEQCHPGNIFGEQVASKDGLGWLDLVFSDLEGAGYAIAPTDLCAAGVGAPHIRQRLWIVADADWQQRHWGGDGGAAGRGELADFGATSRLDHHHHPRLEGLGRGHQAEGGRLGAVRSVAEAGEFGGVADDRSRGREVALFDDGSGRAQAGQRQAGGLGMRGAIGGEAAGPTNSHWRDADWLLCRDGKWRPVEPGTFPLAHGAPARVGRLRAYGNAICAEAAETVIRAYLEPKQGDSPKWLI